jgi:hypothetical protein
VAGRRRNGWQSGSAKMGQLRYAPRRFHYLRRRSIRSSLGREARDVHNRSERHGRVTLGKWSRHPDVPELQRGFKNVNAERPRCLPGIYGSFSTVSWSFASNAGLLLRDSANYSRFGFVRLGIEHRRISCGCGLEQVIFGKPTCSSSSFKANSHSIAERGQVRRHCRAV